MLAPPNDFGYSPSHHGQPMPGYDQYHHVQPHHSGERPKLFPMDPHGHMPGMSGHHEYGAPVHHHHQGMPSQGPPQGSHHQVQSDYDHEPLMMNMHQHHQFYQPMGSQMLHVGGGSTDYGSGGSAGGATPSSGSKRSREELNMKEKKRMFKLNDRINQLRDVLEEAGVQSKKNKQSILDNTAHYIAMLRSNLLIAKQKADRAEKQAEIFRAQADKYSTGNGNTLSVTSSTSADAIFKRAFQQSSTPRLLVDAKSLQLVAYNTAFLQHSGVSSDMVAGLDTVRDHLCLDRSKLDSVLRQMADNRSSGSVSAIVQARTTSGTATLTLVASAVSAAHGQPASTIEFSLIPFEISAQMPVNQTVGSKTAADESSPSSVAAELSF